jgi:tRNA G18 (ribose-2'-O)-methylase SpoU
VAPESIADPDDPRIAMYRNVADPDLLHAHGVFVAEGRLVVRRLLTASRFRTRSVLVTGAAYTALRDLLDTAAAPVYIVPQTALNVIAGFNIHRGCLAIGERGPAREWRQLAGGARQLLLLERIANADNVGSIFRNAAAFGVDAVLLDPASTDPLYRKAIRTSMGAALTLPFARLDPWIDALRDLKRRGVTLIGLTPRAATTMREAAAIAHGQPVALLLGHEGEGLSEGALRECDHLARIPMPGGVDSLNVGTAAAVALYEFARE